MAKKCVHKGCGKTFEDENEECVYHPGPPVFHEGQKGWKCCKPRVLTFDEFLSIPPCTTGKHSEVDDTPAPEPVNNAPDTDSAAPASEKPQVSMESLSAALPFAAAGTRTAQQAQGASAVQRQASPEPPESENDDPSIAIKDGQTCRRRGCTQTYKEGASRDDEKCVHHPGAPIFHEGSKGWSCCKRRVLEFDQFMNIEGCKTKDRHLFVGSGKEKSSEEEKLETVRHDFYQTATSVIASLYLKKIDKDTSTVEFSSSHVKLDLRTQDSKRYQTDMPLFAAIDPEASSYKIMGTKLELSFRKAGGESWPVLRKDDRPTGERIQVGKAARVL
jgi:hypothetical protein